jgi:tRNA-Thr(GGU) m(6)t(6)A37 methyltransferase TsaA
MTGEQEIRPGEAAIDWRVRADAAVSFIGVIETPWKTRAECPRQGDWNGPLCRISLDDIWRQALTGIERHARLEIIYWLHRSRRDLVLRCARGDHAPKGSFALRSPVRPNPIGTSIVVLESVEDCALLVRGLDCVDGTPLIDVKPDRAGCRGGFDAPAR